MATTRKVSSSGGISRRITPAKRRTPAKRSPPIRSTRSPSNRSSRDRNRPRSSINGVVSLEYDSRSSDDSLSSDGAGSPGSRSVDSKGRNGSEVSSISSKEDGGESLSGSEQGEEEDDKDNTGTEPDTDLPNRSACKDLSSRPLIPTGPNKVDSKKLKVDFFSMNKLVNLPTAIRSYAALESRFKDLVDSYLLERSKWCEVRYSAVIKCKELFNNCKEQSSNFVKETKKFSTYENKLNKDNHQLNLKLDRSNEAVKSLKSKVLADMKEERAKHAKSMKIEKSKYNKLLIRFKKVEKILNKNKSGDRLEVGVSKSDTVDMYARKLEIKNTFQERNIRMKQELAEEKKKADIERKRRRAEETSSIVSVAPTGHFQQRPWRQPTLMVSYQIYIYVFLLILKSYINKNTGSSSPSFPPCRGLQGLPGE